MGDYPANQSSEQMEQQSANASDEAAKQDGQAIADTRLRALVAYKRMLTFQFSGTAILVILVTIALWGSYSFGKVTPPLLVLIMLGGMLGAFFSALTRLYNVDVAGISLITPTIRDLGGRYLLVYSFVPPVIGAIAAVVLYLVFVGGLLDGGLFPEISCASGKSCLSLADLMNNYWPSQPEDYGKALVWAFAAGFSERLVPDVLQGLVAKAGSTEQQQA